MWYRWWSGITMTVSGLKEECASYGYSREELHLEKAELGLC